MHIKIEVADVTRKNDVKRLHDLMLNGMPSIGGIVNGAMLLADGIFIDMPFSKMQQILGPKIKGSLKLHNVFSDAKLDFFLMLSSVNAVTGMVGQANYTAANNVRNATQ